MPKGEVAELAAVLPASRIFLATEFFYPTVILFADGLRVSVWKTLVPFF
jgi:hypothetical protein